MPDKLCLLMYKTVNFSAFVAKKLNMKIKIQNKNGKVNNLFLMNKPEAMMMKLVVQL